MNKKKPESSLIVDVKIHYQGKMYKFTLNRMLRWLLPLAIIIAQGAKLISHLRESAAW
ncbi:hypothetical protein WDW37_20400 [Bdellovibrionota bacterium FG-1]